MVKKLEISRDIAASPEVVYAAISDVTRMGRRGCRVTEWNEDLRLESAMEISRQISGVDDRSQRNRQTMSGTLERLAAALEG